MMFWMLTSESTEELALSLVSFPSREWIILEASSKTTRISLITPSPAIFANCATCSSVDLKNSFS